MKWEGWPFCGRGMHDIARRPDSGRAFGFNWLAEFSRRVGETGSNPGWFDAECHFAVSDDVIFFRLRRAA
jgi:hypothetical protein